MNQQLLAEVTGCTALPTLPGIAMHVLELARQPDVDLRDIAGLITKDPALSSKMLRTVNSSFYGLSKPVGTISQAMVILGLQSVKTLALGFSLVGTLNGARPTGFNHVAYWRRSIYSAVAGRTLGEHTKMMQTEEIFVASLLQDIGALALHAALGDRYCAVCQKATDQSQLLALEAAELDLTHAQVGEALAKQWRLPQTLAATIAHHHDHQQAPEDLRQMARVVEMAGALAEVFVVQDAASAIATARKQCQDAFGLDSTAVDDMLHVVSNSAREAADLLEVNIGKQVDYHTILARANQALLDLSLQSQRRAMELEDHNRQLQAAASADPLTGTANRARFGEFIQQQFQRAKRFLRPLSVLFLDADHFKRVNDTFGHAAGDVVLKSLARILQEACRGTDLVCRYGGEEFTCVLSETDLLTAAQLAESIRVAVAEQTILHEGRTIPVTVSIGVACMEGGQYFTSADQLLECADRAVYAAKRDGRNRVRIFNVAAAHKS